MVLKNRLGFRDELVAAVLASTELQGTVKQPSGRAFPPPPSSTGSSFSVVLGGIGPKKDSLSLLLNVLISGHAARIDLNPTQTLGGHHLPCGGNCCRA